MLDGADRLSAAASALGMMREIIASRLQLFTQISERFYRVGLRACRLNVKILSGPRTSAPSNDSQEQTQFADVHAVPPTRAMMNWPPPEYALCSDVFF